MDAPRRGFSVLIIDMFHHDPDEDYTIDGFASVEIAREFARRWVRDSVEEHRRPGQTAEQLRDAWFAFGEHAVVVGDDYKPFQELKDFIARPATAAERDWKSLRPSAPSSG